MSWVDAATLGVHRCETCALVLAAPLPERCPRCAAALHERKPRSIERTMAWLATAVLLYIPANLLPVMSTQSVFGDHQHTLAGGIRDLWVEGSRELAVIVFVASIAVPIGKIAALALLVFTAARASVWRQRDRAVLYRLVETVGHWSMLDVFVVVLLVGMVRFGALAGVEPEAGLAAFGGVVVATMLASAAFDPRLIWPRGDAQDVVQGRVHEDARRRAHGASAP